MKRVLLFLCLLGTDKVLFGQYVYTINADSVKITNHCDTAELILENHTQTVPGFLFNKGRGRTEFRRVMQQLNATTYLIGGDTLFTSPNAWMQGGNAFGTTGILGTLDNNHLDIYTNNIRQARWLNNGNLLLGSTADYGYKLQLAGTNGNIFLNPNLSTPDDRIMIGGAINTGDGQKVLIRTSADGGNSYTNVLVERSGMIGLGNSGVPSGGWWVGAPAIRNFPDGRVGIISPAFYYGQDNGPYASSQLLTTVSNTNEWFTADAYPNGQNYYYFGTVLNGTYGPYAAYKRAPLRISARELQFFTSATEVEAGRFTEAGNLLLGTGNDNGSRLQVNGTIFQASGATASFGNGLYFDQLNSSPRIFAGSEIIYQSNNAGDQHLFENSIGTAFTGTLVTMDPGGYPALPDNQLTLKVLGKEGAIGLNVNMLGYTGIGTFTPTAQLHTTGTVRFAGLTPDSSQTRVLVSDANGNLFYRNLSSWASNGVFNSSLAVKGILSAQQVKLMPVGWADYVFDKTYHLPSLAEVDRYIKQNNHLPGIPAAAEVKQNGIDVGESQAALLKKVEELTLYAISQDKRLEAQNQQLKKQQEEIEQLKKQNNELKTIKREIAEMKKHIGN